MTQEEKDLLLKDLCARLIYMDNLKVAKYIERDGKISDLIPELRFTIGLYELSFRNSNVIIKPYLRPMSSMTEEEEKEAEDFGFGYYDEGIYEKEDGERIVFGNKTFQLIPTIETYDWLKSHNFDYRGLIEKGLALEALEGMYKI